MPCPAMQGPLGNPGQRSFAYCPSLLFPWLWVESVSSSSFIPPATMLKSKCIFITGFSVVRPSLGSGVARKGWKGHPFQVSCCLGGHEHTAVIRDKPLHLKAPEMRQLAYSCILLQARILSATAQETELSGKASRVEPLHIA